jgi:hypothetical protein
MIYTTENNWYKWSYDDGSMFEGSPSSDSKFKTHYGKYNGSIGKFKEELLKAAKSTLDHYPGLRPCIFFSGGVDSELILRSYLEIGSNPEVFIVRYENDYNIYDVSYAITVCLSLGVEYKLINFNLKKFYETDAESVSEIAEIDRPRILPHLKFTECADGLIIVGHSDVRWYRPHNDYSQKAIWLAQDFEHDIGCDKYNIRKNRTAIYQWWKWTPGLILSYTKLNWFKKLVNDEYHGKLGINSTKYTGFSEVYPNLIYRKKQTGFELVDDLILEFESFLNKKYNGLPFRRFQDRTIDQVWLEITGKSYLEY